LGLLASPIISLAQANVEFDKRNFESRLEAFKEAKKNLEQGNEYYEQGDGFYTLALQYYLKANVFNSNNGLLNYKIGVCYLKSFEKEKAIRYFQKAEKLVSNVSPDLHLRMGEAYHVNYKFEEAIAEFKKYKGNLSPEDLNTNTKMLNKKIAECETAIKLMKDSVRAFIDNIGNAVNTGFHDYAPLITTDESMMIFTSKRVGSVGNKPDKNNEYDEDIYVTFKEGPQWKQAINVGSPINTKGNDATIGLSPDGQQLFIYKSDNGGDIFVSKKTGDFWSEPKGLLGSINSPWHESAASFSYDNNTIYFCSNNQEKNNYGDHDIFMSKKDAKGKWGEPVNLGSVINSEYDEADVFMHPDGRTMYFCSNGHKTMGGYDIFKTTLKDDGTWTEPENVGYPLNTPSDDRFFVLAGDGKHGYYSSAKIGGFGGHDLYRITLLGPEKQLIQSNEDNLIACLANPIKEKVQIEQTVEIKTSRLTIVKGAVIDGFAPERTPLEALIEITDNATGQVISSVTSNASTGKFLIPLPSGKDYGIAVKKEGYLFHSENFNIPATSNYQEILMDIKLLKMQKEAKIVLKNVFFEFGKSTLKPESYSELDRLIEILTTNPKMKIEIGGHTDNKSSRDFNLKLSEARAKAVVDYLAKSIPMTRLSYKGYAFDSPVASNDTEDGRAQNRRVEFKILSNE